MSKYTNIVFIKELKDTFRDKKTIISSLLIPILIFPLIAFAIGFGSSDMVKESKEPVKISVISEGDSSFLDFLKDNKDVEIIEKDDPKKALEKLDIKAIVKIKEGFDDKLERGDNPEIEIIYDESSQKSEMARSRMTEIISIYTQSVVEKRLNDVGVDISILEPIDIKAVSVSKEGGIGTMMMSMMLPLMLTLWSAVGGIAAATDLGAGEKERQTLEPLLTTKASRSSILMGKYFAVVVAGVLGTLASLIGFLIATKINPDFMGEGISMSIVGVGIISLVCLLLAFAFASIELAISFYARSFKEAQTYLSPITIIIMVPVYLTMFVDGKAVPEYYFHIPILNTIGIIKEIVVSVYNYKHIIITVGWSIIYILFFLFITVKMFEKEEVVFRN
ncbi:ABC transporter permease [Anaerosalibacter sp. Marseille-P3206]|uniref:ABC transporter permease n=1 Tax=Anaerosalibacter sp. Marseille-P3206 TaxID=1871005 RepID=UPI0009856D42|nr:ABC transporter permease [Anaerosalibacter sp. Marseille-P3206]